MKILNFGSLNIDHVYQVEHIVGKGETLQAQEKSIFCGGKGLNQSIALARAGAEVYHAGIIGRDGGMLKEKLESSGVNTALLKCVEGASSHTIIQVDSKGNNCILFFADRLLDIGQDYIEEVVNQFGAGDYILLQNELNHTELIMEAAHRRGMKIVLNPSPINDRLRCFPLDYVDIFILNEIEGHALTGQTEPEAILRDMGKEYPGAMTVLTLGERGSCCLKDGRLISQEACPAAAVDTTAAGDTFTGYFMAEYLRIGKRAEALALAARAAALSVMRPGAADSIPMREELGV